MIRIGLISVMAFVLTACGEGFEQAQTNGNSKLGDVCQASCDGDNGDDQDNNGNNGNVIDPVLTPTLNGKVSGGVWDGKELLKLDLEEKSLLLRVPVDFETSFVSGSFPIPGHSDMKLEFATDENDSKFLQLRVPLRKLLGDAKLPTEKALPNGDSLPMIPGGKLPHTQTKVGSSEVHVYMGRGTFGLFIPTGFNPFVTLVFPIKNSDKETLGHFATVAKKNDHKGGFYVSLTLPEKLKKVIDLWLPEEE